MNQMNRVNELKKLLGEGYSFEQRMSKQKAARLKAKPPVHFSEQIAAVLVAGCLRIDAVLYESGDGISLGYDVFVKDDPGSPEWICYDNLPEQDSFEETQMLAALDSVVEENGLSYTECCFARLEGKEISPKEKSPTLAL